MYKISQNTFRHEGLPPDFAQDIDGALKDVGRDLGRLAGLVEKVSMECAKMEAERQQIQATAGVQAVEIERLRAQLEALRMGLSAAEKHNDEVQSTYQSILLTKEEQNKRNHEQLQVCHYLTCTVRTRATDANAESRLASSNLMASATCSTLQVVTSRRRQRSWRCSVITSTERRPELFRPSSTRTHTIRARSSIFSWATTLKVNPAQVRNTRYMTLSLTLTLTYELSVVSAF